MRILMVGDLHGDTAALIKVLACAVDKGADVIVQLGDFGFWPRVEFGRKFLRKAEARLAEVGLELWWVDGNHEDHQALATRRIESDGRRRVSDHVWHLPRGHRWMWGNTVWVAAGGAVSVDRYRGSEGKWWFPDEVLTDTEVDQIIDLGHADVIVAHDAPWGAGTLERLFSFDLPPSERQSSWPVDRLEESDTHMRRVGRLVDGVGAGRFFHGHLHVHYDDELAAPHGSVEIRGLGDNRTPIDELSLLVDETGRPIP